MRSAELISMRRAVVLADLERSFDEASWVRRSDPELDASALRGSFGLRLGLAFGMTMLSCPSWFRSQPQA
jgi:hypothetical protein